MIQSVIDRTTVYTQSLAGECMILIFWEKKSLSLDLLCTDCVRHCCKHFAGPVSFLLPQSFEVASDIYPHFKDLEIDS